MPSDVTSESWPYILNDYGSFIRKFLKIRLQSQIVVQWLHIIWKDYATLRDIRTS